MAAVPNGSTPLETEWEARTCEGAWSRSTTPSCYKEPAQVAHAFHRESYSKDFGLDRNSSRYILNVIWPAINSGSPRRSLEMLLGKRKSGIFCLMCFYNDPTLDKRKKIKDGLVVNTIFFILTKILSLLTDKKNLPTPNDMLLAVGIWRQLLFLP